MSKLIIKKNKQNKHGLAPIYYQYSYLGKSNIYGLSVFCKPENWDENLQRVKKTEREHKGCNGKITEFLKSVERAEAIMLASNIEPSFENFKKTIEFAPKIDFEKEAILDEFQKGHDIIKSATQRFNNLIAESGLYTEEEINAPLTPEEENVIDEFISAPAKKINPITAKENEFDAAWLEYMDFSKKNKSEETYSRYEGDLNTVKKFLSEINKPCIFETFAEKDFGSNFQHYLLTKHYNYMTKQNGVCATTAFTICKAISTFLGWCMDEDRKLCAIHINLKKIRMKRPDTDCHYLTEEEIRPLITLMKAQTLSPSLQESLEIWIVSAFTGFRYGDLKRLKRSCIVNGFIRLTTKKTKTSAVVPIHSNVKWILDKYKDVLPNMKNPLAIPMKANAQLNLDIKEILALPEIGYNSNEYLRGKELDYGSLGKKEFEKPLAQLITMHSGRRSFINYAVNRNMHINHLASILGCDTKNIARYYKADPFALQKAFSVLEDTSETELKVAA